MFELIVVAFLLGCAWYAIRHGFIELGVFLPISGFVCLVFLLMYTWPIVSSAVFPPKPSPPPRLEILSGITIEKIDSGIFSTDIVLKNGSPSILLDVELTVTLYRDDGGKPEMKKFWARWKENESQTVNVPVASYEKLSLSGTATQFGKKVEIDSVWTLNKRQ